MFLKIVSIIYYESEKSNNRERICTYSQIIIVDNQNIFDAKSRLPFFACIFLNPTELYYFDNTLDVEDSRNHCHSRFEVLNPLSLIRKEYTTLEVEFDNKLGYN